MTLLNRDQREPRGKKGKNHKATRVPYHVHIYTPYRHVYLLYREAAGRPILVFPSSLAMGYLFCHGANHKEFSTKERRATEERGGGEKERENSLWTLADIPGPVCVRVCSCSIYTEHSAIHTHTHTHTHRFDVCVHGLIRADPNLANLCRRRAVC